MRHDRPERMDDPALPPDDLRRALLDIRWVNRWLGGAAAIIGALKPRVRMLPIEQPVHILDLGTGSADIPLALARWGRATGRVFRITAVDSHPVVVSEARSLTRTCSEIRVVRENALSFPDPDGSFDFVISSMFLHHLSPPEAVQLLQNMARLCRRGLVINDLERHPLAWLGIRLLGRLTGKGRVFRHDAPLSVLRGFTRPELQALCQQAGLAQARIVRRHPYRWLLIWEKTVCSRDNARDGW
jgi:SAM-dependent methyltransferase